MNIFKESGIRTKNMLLKLRENNRGRKRKNGID